MPRVSLNRQILALAIPAIVANITTPLLSLVDVAIVGHLGSAAYVGAIAVGGSMFSMIYWLFGFLRFGTSGITAQTLGRGERELATLPLQRSLLIALASGVAIIALQGVLGHAVLRFLDPDPATERIAATYFGILVWGAPAVLATYSLTGWYVGMQDTRTPMWVSLLINVVNIGMSLLLVYHFHLGITGVAVGTLTAQWTGCLTGLGVCTLGRRYRGYPRSGLRRVMHGGELMRFFKVNADIFLRTVCLIAVTVWFTRAGAAQGPVTLAANSVLLQFFMFFSYLMDGFAFAGEALCGVAWGAGNRPLLSLQIRKLLGWGLALALLFTAIYAAGGEAMVCLLTDSEQVRAHAVRYLWWACAVPLSGFLAFTWDGILTGVTHTRLMVASMAVATTLFFGLYAWLSPVWGNHALWGAFIVYLVTRGVVQWLLWRRLVTRE